MSDLGLDADLTLDIRQALDQADRLAAAVARGLDSADTSIEITADVAALAPSVDSAIAAADTNVVVTGQADELTGDVTSAIDAADTAVLIDGDASALTGDVTGAIDAADTSVEVDGEAGDVTGSITAAVDAADTDVTVTGTTSGITGAIDAAVDAADTSVAIDVDDTGLDSARDSALDLDSALIASTQSGANLRTALQLGGAGAAAAGIYKLVDAASELEQSVGGTAAIFGEAQGSVSGFARTAAESAGLTEASARTLTSQIGGLLNGFGFTQEKSAELSVTLAKLGADLAATFGGTSQEAVEALGAAIRGETDPIERFGISLNATQADLRAVELGLASSTSEVSANARAQGALSLIMERSAQAQGQFGREVDTTAGQIERLKAESGNAAAAIGATMQPAINELVASARGDLIPTLTELGQNLGPALVKLVTALLPAFGTFGNILSALAPVVGVLASALESIPAPILGALGAFVSLNAAAGKLGGSDGVLRGIGESLSGVVAPARNAVGAFKAAEGGASGLRAGAGALVGSISPLTAVLVAASIGLTAYANHQQEIAEKQRITESTVKSFSATLSEGTTSVRGINDALAEMVSTGAELVVLPEFLNGFKVAADDLFAAAGANVDDFSEAVARGGNTFETYIDTVGRGSENQKFFQESFRDLADQIQEGARSSIDAGVALGDYSRRAADAAIEQSRASDGSRNYAAALDVLEAQAKASAEQQDALASAVGGVDTEGASHRVTELGLRLADLEGPTAGLPQRFAAFALAADAAGLSGAELDAVASDLGVDSELLSDAISQTAQPIRELADAAGSAIPTVADLAGDINNFSVEGFRDALELGYQAVVDFQDNLQALADRPRIAAAAAVLGPQYAADLAEAARDGKTAVLDETELLLEGLQQEGVDLQSLITGEIGPNLQTATGQVGQSMTTAFGEGFDLTGHVTPSIASVEGAIANSTPSLIERAFALGRGGADGFGSGFTPDPAPGVLNADAYIANTTPSFITRMFTLAQSGNLGFGTGFRPDPRPGVTNADAYVAGAQPNFAQRLLGFGGAGTLGFGGGFHPDPNPAISAADSAVAGRYGNWFTRLMGLGGQGTSGFATGTAGISSTAASRADSAIGAFSGRSQAAYSGGYGMGSSIGEGVGAGLADSAGKAAAKASAFLDKVIAKMRTVAGIHSPSTLFRDQVGIPLAQGIAVGIDAGVVDAVRAAETGIEAIGAAAATAATAIPTVALDASVAGAVATAAAGAGAAGVVINIAERAIVVEATDNRADTLDNARAATGVLLTAVSSRSLAVAASTR